MRFWITRNGELSIREQLTRQVLLGILSEDLPAGHKLPSVRALARRHRIHPNTVSAAYHDLLERGWLELRRGSGLYVRPLMAPGDGEAQLDRLLAGVLQSARSQGYEPEEVLNRLDHLIRPRRYERILIAEPEPAMREILQSEIGENLQIPIDAIERPDLSQLGSTLVVALPTRALKIRRELPPGVLCVALRLRSVGATLEGQPRPGADAIISVVSRAAEIRYWARAMLIAAGIDARCICELDSGTTGWKDRLRLSGVIVTDVASARDLPSGCPARVFRVIADSSIAELKQIFSA